MQLNYIFELEEFVVLVKSRHIGQICRFNVRNLCAALSLLEDIPLGYKAQNRSLKIMYDKSMSLISV